MPVYWYDYKKPPDSLVLKMWIRLAQLPWFPGLWCDAVFSCWPHSSVFSSAICPPLLFPWQWGTSPQRLTVPSFTSPPPTPKSSPAHGLWDLLGSEVWGSPVRSVGPLEVRVSEVRGRNHIWNNASVYIGQQLGPQSERIPLIISGLVTGFSVSGSVDSNFNCPILV